MWRGGLSGPKSVFVHADRPLISSDLSSPILHELMHTVMGARSGDDGDWVVEGLAELYSLKLLVRSKTVSRRRYARALERMEEKGRGVAGLARKDSSGALTARAVVVLDQVDQEIEAATDGASSLDDVVRRLSAERGVVTSEHFRSIAEEVAGRQLAVFARSDFQRVARSSRATAASPSQ
jgi:predicted metalloprotease with PDZ domain